MTHQTKTPTKLPSGDESLRFGTARCWIDRSTRTSANIGIIWFRMTDELPEEQYSLAEERLSGDTLAVITVPYTSEWALALIVGDAWEALNGVVTECSDDHVLPDNCFLVGYGRAATLTQLLYAKKYSERPSSPIFASVKGILSFSAVLYAHRLDIHRYRYGHLSGERTRLPNNGIATKDKPTLSLSAESNPVTFWGALKSPPPLLIWTGSADEVVPTFISYEHFRYTEGSSLLVEAGARNGLAAVQGWNSINDFLQAACLDRAPSTQEWANAIHLLRDGRMVRKLSRDQVKDSLNLDFDGWADPLAQSIGLVKSARFLSKRLGEEISYLVYLPPGYETSQERYPVVYVSPNPGFPPNAVAYLGGYWDEKMRAGKCPPAIWVMWNKKRTGRYESKLKTVIWRFKNADAAAAEDLIEHVDFTHRTIPSREGRLLEATCNSFFTALNILRRRADCFGSFVLFTPPTLLAPLKDLFTRTICSLRQSGSSWPATTILAGSDDAGAMQTAEYCHKVLLSNGIRSKVFIAAGIEHSFNSFLIDLAPTNFISETFSFPSAVPENSPSLAKISSDRDSAPK